MSLSEVAQELEKVASINGVELFVDDTTLNHNFIPVINGRGVVGAIGEYLEKNSVKMGFFILNSKVVRYALDEGFNKDELYECFKDRLFDEIDRNKFFKIMTEKEV